MLIKMTRVLTTEGTFQISKYTVNSNTKYQIEFLLRQYLLLDLILPAAADLVFREQVFVKFGGNDEDDHDDDNDDADDDADNDDDGNDDEQLLVIVTKWECF